MESPKYKNGQIVYTLGADVNWWTVTAVTPNKNGSYDYIVKRDKFTQTVPAEHLLGSKLEIVKALHAKAKWEIEKINKNEKLAGAGKKMQASLIRKHVALFIKAADKLP